MCLALPIFIVAEDSHNIVYSHVLLFQGVSYFIEIPIGYQVGYLEVEIVVR